MWRAVQKHGVLAYHEHMYLTYPKPRHLDYLQSHTMQWSPDDSALYGIVLRDPADWLVSVYHHTINRVRFSSYGDGAGGPSFEVWYDWAGEEPTLHTTVTRNRMATYLGRFAGSPRMADIAAMLRSIWWVAVTETLNDDWRVIAKYLHIPPAIGKERAAGGFDTIENHPTETWYSLTDNMRDRIYEENKRDCKLYAIALEERGRNADSMG